MRTKAANRAGAGGAPMDGEQDAHWRHALYVVGQVVLVGWFLGISFYFYHKQGYLLLIRKIGKGLFW